MDFFFFKRSTVLKKKNLFGRQSGVSPLSSGGGHRDLRYCGIEFFFKRYFGDFDFNVRYCGII